MSHPIEFEQTLNKGGGLRVVTLRVQSSVTCDKVLSSSSTSYAAGPSYYHSRAASVHTVQDPDTGWRPPKPYYYTDILADNPRSGFVGANKASCPTYKWIGIPVVSAQVWPWAAHAGLTPFDRNGGADRTNLQNWVKTKALSKLNRFDINLGESFGERKQTYQLVKNAIQDIRWFWRRLRMGDFSSLYNYLRYNIGGDPWKAYLQCRYGWRPLLYDIQGGIDLIEKLENGSYKKHHVYVKSHKEVPYNTNGTRPLFSLFGKNMFSSRYSIKGTELVKVRYDYNLRNSDYVTAASLGLGLHTPWELTSLSFVADWFINVGRFLEAMSMLPGWTFQGGSMTSVGKYKGQAGIVPDNGYILSGSGGMQYTAFTFKREIAVVPPLPTLAINPSILDTLLSDNGARIIDMVALMMTDAGKTSKFLRGI